MPSFELQAEPSALQQLTKGLDGWRVERSEGKASKVWLRTSDGMVWQIGISRREVRPLFEVFTLGMLSLGELDQRWESWEPPVIQGDVPGNIRQLLTTRPRAPSAPRDFDPWPLQSWRTEVVRRAEFVVDDEAAGPAREDGPERQSAAGPLVVPPNASAFCEVAAGILFTGNDGRRLLIAVDWMPMNILVIEDAADINTEGSGCELIRMENYPAPAFPDF